MKRFTILLLVAVMLLASCGAPAPVTVVEDTAKTPENEVLVENVEDTGHEPAPVFKVEGTILDIDRDEKVTTTFSTDVVRANQVEKKYVKKTEGGFTFIDIEDPHIAISGFPFSETNSIKYYRLEYQNHAKYTENLQSLAHNAAGARVRFKTNAASIKVSVTLKNAHYFAHMPDTGTCGCDVYVGSGINTIWVDNVDPGSDAKSYTREIPLPAGTKEVMIVLPLYAGIQEMSIGIPTTSAISSPDPYLIEDPILYYGSSITQGACTSRPGMSYPDITARLFGANLVNLGFSSGALGEQVVANGIAKIKMSAFIYDFDHNGGVENLRNTHYDFYKTIRDAQPDLPIIMISRFSWGYSGSDSELTERRAIIKATYDKAVAAGDKNVYFIDGENVYPAEYRDFCLVDGTHPNDLGMYFVANAIYPVLKDALTKAGYIK